MAPSRQAMSRLGLASQLTILKVDFKAEPMILMGIPLPPSLWEALYVLTMNQA
jgi:hypothetical protein